MRKILLLSATHLEHGVNSIEDNPIFETGVGKISAANTTTHLIHQHKPDLVINFGSCGNLKNYKIGEVIRIGKVYNDIDTRPFSDYGFTPFSKYGPIKFDVSDVECFSTDYFYDSTQTHYSEKYMEMIKTCDVVDMELYAIAQVCDTMGVPLQSYKWISDDGSSDDWSKNAKLGFDAFKNYYINTFKK